MQKLEHWQTASTSMPARSKLEMSDDWFGPIIYIICLFTITTPTVLLGGVPRLTLAALAASAYFFLKVRGRIQTPYLFFVVAYVAAFTPGSIVAAANGTLDFLSCVQLAASLIIFMMLGTYFALWMRDTPDDKKAQTLGRLILFCFFISAVEIVFYEQFHNIRLQLFRSEFSQHYARIFLNRELALYGGRPTGLFSETSNFARFLGLVVAAYMAVTRCSKRSILALLISIVLLRSVSVLFAAPALALIIIKVSSLKWRGRVLRQIPLIMAASIAIAAGVVATQGDRIQAAMNSSDGSFNSRIFYPALYIMENSSDLAWGKGASPQQEIQEFTQKKQYSNQNIVQVSGFNEGISNLFVLLAGMGFVGFFLFFSLLLLLSGWKGLLLGIAFLVSNSIASGYNSAALFAPAALLQAIIIYTLAIQKPGIETAGERPPKVLSP